ncbi:MAG: carboxymuconolactone decarboxylase family protein [Alphaproteobacteria bacterium]
MPRIPAIQPDAAQGKTLELFAAIGRQLGGVPNILRTMGHSPAALEGYLGFATALAGGTFAPAFREQIALAVAGANGCDYCASAHSAIGRKLKLADDEIRRNLHGDASDPKVAAALGFARKLVRERGHASDGDIAAIRLAGYGEAEIVELIAHVALNLFTNYFNHAVGTDIDFPVVLSAAARAA